MSAMFVVSVSDSDFTKGKKLLLSSGQSVWLISTLCTSNNSQTLLQGSRRQRGNYYTVNEASKADPGSVSDRAIVK